MNNRAPFLYVFCAANFNLFSCRCIFIFFIYNHKKDRRYILLTFIILYSIKY